MPARLACSECVASSSTTTPRNSECVASTASGARSSACAAGTRLAHTLSADLRLGLGNTGTVCNNAVHCDSVVGYSAAETARGRNARPARTVGHTLPRCSRPALLVVGVAGRVLGVVMPRRYSLPWG